MKRIATVAMLFLIAITLTKAGTPALARTATTPEATVRRFYAWYLHALKQGKSPIQNRAQLSQFVTQRLMKSINRALNRSDGINADFFIDAQDWDDAWEKNISISKAKIRGDRATVTVTLKGGPSFGNKRLNVGLQKEGGVWKIDSVNGNTTL